MASAPGVDSKTQATTAFSAPWRTTSAEDFAAHQQGQRIHQDGFARAGFAGEQVEARAEDGNGVINDGVVFRAQFDEHFLGVNLLNRSRSLSWQVMVSAQTIRAQHSMKGGLWASRKQL